MTPVNPASSEEGGTPEPLIALDGGNWRHNCATDTVQIGRMVYPRLVWIAALERLGREAGIEPASIPLPQEEGPTPDAWMIIARGGRFYYGFKDIAEHVAQGFRDEYGPDDVSIAPLYLSARVSPPVGAPIPNPLLAQSGLTRDLLGELVREAWVRWANQHPNPKPHWLAPWSELGESDREADRQIGESIALHAIAHYTASLPAHPVGATDTDTTFALQDAEAIEELARLVLSDGVGGVTRERLAQRLTGCAQRLRGFAAARSQGGREDGT